MRIVVFLIINLLTVNVYADYPVKLTYSRTLASYAFNGVVNVSQYYGADYTVVCAAVNAVATSSTYANKAPSPTSTALSLQCTTNGGNASGTDGINYVSFAPSKTCPEGGTVSGTSCINVPSCTAPKYRQTVAPYACIDPIQCTPPEKDNGFGVCEVSECTASQVLNPTSGECQTPPTCATSERYDASTNTCYLKTLECPVHSHANTANDACLPDAPLACPTGQHDDGTYNCVADDATACKSNQTTGYINGKMACINPPVLDTAQKAAADAAKTAAATADTSNASQQAALKTAQQAATTARNNLNDAEFNYAQNPDSTNLANLQAAMTANNSAQNALSTAHADAEIAKNQATAAAESANRSHDEYDRALQESTNYEIKKQGEKLDAMTAGTAGTVNHAAAGTFDNETPDNAVEDAKTAFQNQWDTDKASLTSLFDFNTSATAALPIFDYGTIMGVHVVVDLNTYAVPLNYIGLMVMFMAAFLSVRLFLE